MLRYRDHKRNRNTMLNSSSVFLLTVIPFFLSLRPLNSTHVHKCIHHIVFYRNDSGDNCMRNVKTRVWKRSETNRNAFVVVDQSNSTRADRHDTRIYVLVKDRVTIIDHYLEGFGTLFERFKFFF